MKSILNFKYLISRSLGVLTITMSTALLVSFFLTHLVEVYRMTKQPPDSLSYEYCSFYIGENREKIYEKNLTLTDLISELRNEDEGFVILKASHTQITGVYCYKKSFYPELVSGRAFTEEDFINHTNTALVSEELYRRLIGSNEETFLLYDNNYFEIIGVYSRSDNIINEDAYAYYNLGFTNISNRNNNTSEQYSILGQYALDAGVKTQKLVDKADAFCSITILRKVNGDGFIETLKSVLSRQFVTISSFLLVLIMLVLNSLNVTANWIDGRKKEIFVRRITGATNGDIARNLLWDYLFLSSASFIVGFLVAFFLSKINFTLFVGFNFSIMSALIVYIFITAFSLLSFAVQFVFVMRGSILYTRWR